MHMNDAHELRVCLSVLASLQLF